MTEEVSRPHFAVPFNWGSNGHANVVEQGSAEDLMQQVEAVLRTNIGFRLEIPEFGIESLLFEEGPLDLAGIEAAITEWAPKAAQHITEEQLVDILERLATVGVEVDNG